jgi:hypothetical protein
MRLRSHALSIGLVVCVVLIGIGSIGPSVPANAQGPLSFASETGLDIDTVQAVDGTVYYGGLYCGGELANPYTFLRARPASGGGVTRSLHEGSQVCNASKYAVDDQFVYWINKQKQLQRVSRGASANPPPVAVSTAIAIGASFELYELKVTATHIYWIESNNGTNASRLVRVPKSGGSSQTVSFTGLARELHIDAAGAAYYLVENNWFRAVPGATSFTLATLGTASQVQTFTIDGASLFWIEKTGVAEQYQLLTAPVSAPSPATPVWIFSRPNDPQVTSLIADGNNVYWMETLLTPISRAFYRIPRSGGAPVLLGGSSIYGTELATDSQFLYYTEKRDASSIGRVMRILVGGGGVDIVSPQANIEAVQAIQGPANDVPLVANKDTFARVYAQVQNAGIGFSVVVAPLAELHGSRNGTPLPGSPLAPISVPVTISTAALDRRKEANSALFQLPKSWVNGTVELRAVLNPAGSLDEGNQANNTIVTTVTFQHVPRPCLLMVPVATTAGTLTGPAPSFTPFFERAASVWPVDQFNVTFNAGPAQRRPRDALGILGSVPYDLRSGPIPEVEMSHLLWNLWWTFNFSTGFACDGAGTTTVAGVPDAARFGMASLDVLFYLQSASRSAGPWTMPRGGTAGLAHELGHAWGRGHVDCGNPSFPAPFPYPPCQLDSSDGPLSHVGFDAITRSVIPPLSSADYMSYSDPLWTSDHTYRDLFNMLGGGSANSSAGATAAITDAILVSGLIGERPHIGFAVHVTGATLQDLNSQLAATTQPSTQYRLLAFDAGGNPVVNQPLLVSEIETEGATPTMIFANLVPVQPKPVRFEVRNTAGATLLRRTAGPNPPQIALVSPTGGVTVGSTIDVRWSASDPDGDPLISTVRYSPDNGNRWYVLGEQTADQRMMVSVDAALPGGAQARLQVITSDGVNSTSATSAPFAVPQRAPQVAILDSAYRQLGATQPGGGQQSDELTLKAYAYDAEDGQLSDTALQWALTGPEIRSGTGQVVRFSSLTPGAYQVSLTATDSAGLSTQALAIINVSPKRVFDSAAPTLDGSCADIAYAADADPIALRYAPGLTSTGERNAQVRLVRAGDWLYACFAGLIWGNEPNGFAALQFNLDNSSETMIDAADRGFFVRKDGAFYTGSGSNATGTGFAIDPDPQGLTASIRRNGDYWSAEMRIDIGQLGGWNKLVRLNTAHFWRDSIGDDTLWPRNAGYNAPNTWGLTALGSRNQAITFNTIPDQLMGASSFLLTATATSGLPLSYVSTGACEVVGNELHIRGLGTCVVTAAQPGDAVYTAAVPVTRTFRVLTLLFVPTVRR